MSVRSGLVLVCCLLGTYLGCAGKSQSELDGPIIFPVAGEGAGDQSGSAGKGAPGGKGGTGATGGKGGTTTGTGGTTQGSGGTSTGTGGVGTGGSFGAGGTAIATGGGSTRGGAGGTGGGTGRGGEGPAGTGGTVARGGRGGSAGTGVVFGGAAGRGGTGGGGGTGGHVQAGSGGQAGSIATGGTGGTSVIPNTWNCSTKAYADGTCDCGCGAVDKDCATGTLAECARCNAPGSCGLATCPGRIDASNVTRCLAPPSAWTCGAEAYADGTTCDCGCGATDPDCKDHSNGVCDTCNSPGSCGRTTCPSSVDPDDNSKCSVPALWTCDPYYYGDGYCNCGCGVTDVDCASTLASQCWDCPWDSCSPYSCGTLVSNDNAHCTSAPYTWNCPARLYHDGSQCDCGCGAFDPDCDSIDASACDTCDASGSCSKQACSGTITTNQNWYCTPPTPPSSWKCGSYSYGDGFTCDCGCGAPDPDCASTSDVNECNYCPLCAGACPASIDPSDTTRCAPPPSTWTCDVAKFGDNECDCGCGAADVDCYNSTSSACYRCPTEGCSAGVCSHISSTDNTRCSIVAPSTWKCSPAFYADSVCDCGCGVHDPDCMNTDEHACVYCDSPGSCSTAPGCPGTILANDNTACSQ